MQNVFMLALITGIWFWVAGGLVGYTLFSTLKSPTFIGFVLGLIWGDPVKGLIAGGSIEVIYLGMVAAGGNIPSDKALAALIAIPIVLRTDTPIEVAISIAVPVGILGVFINNLRRTGNAFFIHKADDYAEDLNTKGIWNAAFIYPMLFGFLLRFPAVFVANLYGPELVTTFLNVIPAWLLHGLTVMGGLLPALGFATSIFMIGRNEYIPYFIMGFFLVQYLQVPIMAAAIFGTCIAVLISLGKAKREGVLQND